MKNAVIYARFSSENQREESIEDQIRECKAYAERNGYTVLKAYHDHALTGRSDHRPDFQQMIEDSEDGVFNYIICYKTDRFFRNRYEAQKYKRILKDNNVRVVYAKVDIPQGPEGIILEGVLEALDEYYSANLAQNVKRGQTGNAQKCRTNGVKVFGYIRDENDQYAINQNEAIAVNQVFDMVIERKPNVEIINWLNINGYRNTLGNKFTKNSIHGMITNRKYIGEYSFAETTIEHGMPAIIDEARFYKANSIVGSSNKRARKSEFILSDKLYCGECGSTMYGMSGTGKKGKTYYYYVCDSNRKKTGCEMRNVCKDILENAVIDIINGYLFNDKILNDIIDAVIKYQEEHINNHTLNRLQDELKETNKSLSNILKLIEKGTINDLLVNRMNELNDKKNDLETQIKIEEANNQTVDRVMLEYYLKKFKPSGESDYKDKKRLVDTFISKAFLFDDGRIVLTFNYRKNEHLATHEEIIKILDENGVRLGLSGRAKNPKIELKSIYFTNDNIIFVASF